MAVKRAERTEAIPGARPHQQPGWVSAEVTGLGWLDELRSRHEQLVTEFADACEQEAEARDDVAQQDEHHRTEARRALEAGREVPAPPDRAVAEARLAIAREGVVAAEDQLARVVVETLAACRKHRLEISRAAWAGLSAPLQDALERGPGGSVAARIRRIQADLQRMQEREGAGVIDVSTPKHSRLEQGERERGVRSAA
jgi:hypothetical protein